MNIDGVADFLEHLREGGPLDDFELDLVEPTYVDDEGHQRYQVTISIGELKLALSSYVPPIGVREIILRRAMEVSKQRFETSPSSSQPKSKSNRR